MIEPHERYVALGRTAETRGAAYRELFRVHVDEVEIDAIRAATKGNYALGNSRFELEIRRMLKRRVSRGKAGRPRAGKQ